jgi:TRAP-type transport system periplasmic protein
MTRQLAGLALGTAMALVTISQAAAADYTIRLAHSLSATEPAHLAAEFFAANVTERSEGRIEVSVFPGEQLGSGKDVNEMIRQGANVMNITDPGYLSDYVPDVGVLNGPYLLWPTTATSRRSSIPSGWPTSTPSSRQRASGWSPTTTSSAPGT